MQTVYGTVSAKIAPRLKCYKNASRLNRYNFPTDNAIDFRFSTLHTTPFHYEVLKIGSRKRYPLGSYSDSNAMHFYNILTVGQFSRELSHMHPFINAWTVCPYFLIEGFIRFTLLRSAFFFLIWATFSLFASAVKIVHCVCKEGPNSSRDA